MLLYDLKPLHVEKQKK